MIEKSSPVPLYLQLKNILKSSIINGEFKQNEAIPSETQLAETHSITRTTVRRAISELEHDNLVRKEHGRGTFVSLRPVSYSMWNFSSFTEYIRRQGKTPISKILSACTVKVAGKQYYQLERARGVKQETDILFLTIDTSLIPLELFPGIMKYDFENRSLYEVMRKEFLIAPSTVELSVLPYRADERAARIFNIQKNSTLLMVKGHASSEDNRQVEEIQVIYSPNVDFKLATRMNSL